MRKLEQFDERVWDRFFDFVVPDVARMPITEVDAELQLAGIDIQTALTRVTQALDARKAREALARARADRLSALNRFSQIVMAPIHDARAHLERLITARVPLAERPVYLRKLQKVATDTDVQSLLEDLARLEDLDRGDAAT